MNYGDPSFGDAIGQCLDQLEASPVRPFFAGMKDEADKFVNEALAFCDRQRQYQNINQ